MKGLVMAYFDLFYKPTNQPLEHATKQRGKNKYDSGYTAIAPQAIFALASSPLISRSSVHVLRV